MTKTDPKAEPEIAITFRSTSASQRPAVLLDRTFAVTDKASDLRRISPPSEPGYPQTRPVTLRIEATGGAVFVAVGFNPDPTREPRRRIEPGPDHAQVFEAARDASLSAVLAGTA